MKKKIGLLIGIIIIAFIGVICFIFVHKRLVEEKIKMAILRNDNEYFAEHLGITGDFTYSDNKVTVNNRYIDEKGLKVNIAYYNLFHDNKLSYDDLIREYDAFCETGDKEQCEDLSLFCEYGNGGNHGECGVFRTYVSTCLHEKGYDLVNPSDTELEEAIEYATEKFLDERVDE
ncbi:MAG: hypothetical protein PUA62_06515 [Lachnospiraceae bacterium]|nr:hypothetical protein [Lachnospiraceae bacterium]